MVGGTKTPGWSGSQGDIQLSLRDIDTNKPWGRCHGLLPWWPILA
jgi:hypothetical protein